MVDNTSAQARSLENHKLILSSRVKGTPVFNQRGERIGQVDDLSIDRESGQVIFAIMSFGGFLGIGKRYHPLPWSILTYQPTEGGYVVPLPEEALQNAPHYDSEELRELGGPKHQDFNERILAYYGPYGPPFV